MTQKVPTDEIKPSLPHRLRFEQINSIRRSFILIDDVVVYEFDRDDTVIGRFIAVMLSIFSVATNEEIGKAWGVEKQTILLWCENYRGNERTGLEERMQGEATIVTDEHKLYIHVYRSNGVTIDRICHRLNLLQRTVCMKIYNEKKTGSTALKPSVVEVSTDSSSENDCSKDPDKRNYDGAKRRRTSNIQGNAESTKSCRPRKVYI